MFMKPRKQPQWACGILAGLSLACVVGWNTTATADETNVVYYTDFEYNEELGNPGRPAWNPYSYNYNGVSSWQSADANFLELPDQTNTLLNFTFDNTSVQGEAGATGYGEGFGGAVKFLTDVSAMASTNRSDYIFEFDARVEGLLPGVNAASGEFQVRFNTPDDTVQPPDSNTGRDTILQVNYGFQPGSNWTHYVFTLDQGGIGAGSDKSFALYLSSIDEPGFGVNFHTPDVQFGFDADNVVMVDNFKLSVVVKSNAPPVPKYEVTIIDWNFDDKGLWYSWGSGTGGWAANDLRATWSVSHNEAGVGVDGSAAYKMGMDNTVFADNPPGWAGGNTGGGGPGTYTYFDSPDLADYVVSFDAKVEGLAPETLVTSGALLQLSVNAPDDTLLPADSNTGNDQLVRLDIGIPDLETNWQHFAFALSKASLSGGTQKQTFATNYSKVNEVSFQMQILNAQSQGDWGYDADNVVLMDNFKIQRVYVGLSPVGITKTEAGLTVTWSNPTTGTVKLLSAPSVTGQWTEVPNATSPYLVQTEGGARYFRTLWVPPPQ
jgi:hypothetical protein